MISYDPPVEKLEYLIGGNPKGGTHFVANYLTKAGYPCGHESLAVEGTTRFFTDVRPDLPDFSTFKAVCSYTTGEHCNVPPADRVPLMCVLRNPFNVLNSLIMVAIMHREVVDIDSLMNQIIDRYEVLLTNPRLVLAFRVEHDMPRLCQFLDIKPIDESGVGRASRNPGVIGLKWSHIGDFKSARRMMTFAETYEYPRL